MIGAAGEAAVEFRQGRRVGLCPLPDTSEQLAAVGGAGGESLDQGLERGLPAGVGRMQGGGLVCPGAVEGGPPGGPRVPVPSLWASRAPRPRGPPSR